MEFAFEHTCTYGYTFSIFKNIFELIFFLKSQLYFYISLLLLSNFYNFTFSQGDHTLGSKQPPKGSSKGTSYKL